MIEEVLVDDIPAANDSDLIRIRPGKHRLEVHFTAMSLTAPEKVRFKYQLQKLDQELVEAGI